MSMICQISLISKHFSLGKNTINVVDHYWLNWYRQGYSKATEAKDLLHSGQIVCPLNICITKNQSEVMQCEVDHIFALVTVSFIFEPCTDLEWFNIILYRSCAIIFLNWVLSYPTVSSKNFAEKNIHSKRYKSRYIKPSQLASHKKIRLRQNAIMMLMLHSEFIPHFVPKTDWLTWQMIWQLNADQNWEFLQDEQQLNLHKQISENKERLKFPHSPAV